MEELIDDEKLEKLEERIWLNLLQKYNLLLDVLLYDGTNCFHTIRIIPSTARDRRARTKKAGTT